MTRGGAGKVRIIGGLWRRRLVRFDAHPGLRPTPDRVRETLFNWLAPYVGGASCLDLYAGSGVLGFEALSRGAARAVLVDNQRAVVACISAHARELGADNLEVVLQDVPVFLRTAAFRHANGFDLVFVDPPYAGRLVPETLRLLDQYRWVAPGGLVYFESDTPMPAAQLPSGWELMKHRRAGAVHYYLACRAVVPG